MIKKLWGNRRKQKSVDDIVQTANNDIANALGMFSKARQVVVEAIRIREAVRDTRQEQVDELRRSIAKDEAEIAEHKKLEEKLSEFVPKIPEFDN